MAQLSGAIYTTTSTGTTVNGNIYGLKTDVYLNGGPQNKKDPGLPDGTYYFQVTDPSGAVLLSADDISCRQVVVSGGRIVGVPSGSAPSNCSSTTPAGAYHPLGTPNPSNGQTPVELCPSTSPRSDTLGAGQFFDANNWCDTTPNPGGEYKAWITPIGNYSPDPQNPKCSTNSNIRFGFCDSDSKTDNFKVNQGKTNVAFITVCKFNDLNGNGTQDSGEPLIPFWPINATGVDTQSGPIGTVNTQTDATGCVSFSVSDFSPPPPGGTGAGGVVTLTEGLLTGWTETAPIFGNYDASGNPNCAANCSTSVSGFTETITVNAGDKVTAPNFGNTCLVDACGGNTIELTVTKDANPSFTRTFTWGISKTVDNSTVYTAGGASATVNYTVSVTHDNGTDSGWQVTGKIKVSNPSLVDIAGVNVTDAVDNSGTCSVTGGTGTGGTGVTVQAQSEVDLPYTCTYTNLPFTGTNTATAAWDSRSVFGTASIDFTGAPFTAVDGKVTVKDTLGGNLGTVSSTDPSPTNFTYSQTFADPPGTCTSHGNTATFTTNTTGTTGSASQTVKDCQGADLQVSKTVNPPSFSSSITKSVDKTKVEQSGGSATFNYTVKVTTSVWQVGGTITVTNPNDWEPITSVSPVTVTDAIDNGGSCLVTGGTGVTIAASGSTTLNYTCTYLSAPPSAAAFTNTATATWSGSTYHTPHSSASGTKGGMFATLTVSDSVTSSTCPTATTVTLGTVSVTGATTVNSSPGCGITNLSGSSGTFKYSITDTNSSPGTCTSYPNTASIPGSSSSVTVTVCNTNTGALTIGFWKNANGQKIISSYCAPTGGTSLMAYLNTFNPFKDDTATTCSAEATYVNGIISGATCSTGATCNTMLRAQMLATALDVYFSTPVASGGGGNAIGAYNGLGTNQPALGGVAIDLSHICSMTDGSGGATCAGTYEDARPEFGIAPTCTGTMVSQMLAYATYLSGVNGSPVASPTTGATWYKQIKNPNQVYAKDAFDNTNNQIANIAPASCSSTF